MESKKVISIRLTPSKLDEIDSHVSKDFFGWKRQDFIERAIDLALAAQKAGLMQSFMKFKPQFGDVVDKFEFSYHREHS